MAHSQRPASNQSDDARLAILEVVLSCGVCQASVSEVYATHDSNKGFHSGSGDEIGVVTKFWIAECSHTFCGRHLDGGGAPFHQEDHAPRSPCPVCVMTGRGSEKKDLFPVLGLQKGQLPAIIPDDYLSCPPHRMNSHDPSLDAFRFQYFQLTHYSREVGKRRRSAERKKQAVETALAKERKQWRKVEAEMKGRIASLEKSEQKLHKWEQRRDMINHYLGLVIRMSADMEHMRTQLLDLGFNVPKPDYSFESNSKPAPPQQVAPNQPVRADSSATLVGDNTARSSSSRKRKHSIHDDYGPINDGSTGQHLRQDLSTSQHHDGPSSMPPPLPRQRIRTPSVRSIPRSYAHSPISQSQHPKWPAPVPPAAQFPGEAYKREPMHQIHATSGPHSSAMGPPREQMQYAVAHEHGFLPYRPSQRQSQPQELDQDSQSLYSQPHAPNLMSMPPRRLSDRQYFSSQPLVSHDKQQQLEHSNNVSATRKSNFRQPYVGAVQPSAHHEPRELQAYGPPSSQRGRPAVLPERDQTSTRSHGPIPSNSGPSPFFKKPPLPARMEQTLRSEAGSMRSQQVPPTRSSVGSFRMPPNRPTIASSLHGGGVPIRPNIAERFRLVDQSSVRSQVYGPGSDGYYRAPSSQVHHAMNSHQRDAPQATDRPSSQAYRSRMTLPPNLSTSRLSLAGSQDPQVSRIQGVRGVRMPQSSLGRLSLAAASTPSRGIYSASTDRRMVQR